MLGRFIGKAAAMPLRVVNVPVRMAEAALDADLGGDSVERVAKAGEDAVQHAVDGEPDDE